MSNRNRKLFVRYKLTPDGYNALLAAQFGRCKICGVMEWPLHVDHDHVTGRIRGLLCSNCNTGIGLLGDSPDRVRRAAEYLEATSGYL